MSKITIDEVINIIEDALNASAESPISVNLESSSDTIEDWDSMGQLSIIVSLDDQLDNQIEQIPEMAEAKSVKTIIEILKDKGFLAE